jgi:PAS domain S-box-containing protein
MPESSDGISRISDGFFTLDREWRFTFFNEYARNVWNRDPAELVGKVMWEEFPALVESPFAKAYHTAATERVSVCMTDQSSVDGRWYELRVFPIADGLAASFHDITERHLALQALERSAEARERERRMYHAVLGNTPDHHYVFDLDGRFSFASGKLLDMWGVTSDQVIGRAFADLDYDRALAQKLDLQVREVIATGQLVRDETIYTFPTGTDYYEYIFAPVFDAKGRVEAVAGSTRNITERKTEELRLRDEARRKDEFLATLAHELRNPLAPIRNALEVSKLSRGNAAATEQAHEIMERQVANMVHLIDDLLDLSRINLGKVELRLTPTDLAQVIEQAVEIARPHIEQAGHALRLNLPADVLRVNADATRLSQVLANLLINAAKFTPREGHIAISVSVEEANAVVRVRDSGVGIAPEMLAQIFEMFTQAPHTASRAQGGLGIGLTLVKGLVELHGGSVQAASDGVGKGAEFIVRVPLVSRGGTPVATKTDVTRLTSVTPRHILIVDDNVDSAESLSMMLRMLGHETMTAHDGLQALDIAESFLPEVCLLDIGMPNLDGYELAKRLRQKPWAGNILLVALTGWGQEEDKRRSANAGIDFHLIKPVNPAALIALLERHDVTETT